MFYWHNVDFEYYEKPYVPPTWADGTDEEIAEALQKHYAGEIDLHNVAGWEIGSERTVHLNAMAATGVGEGHVEQDVTMVLMNAGGKTLTTPIGSVTECAFVVGQKNMLANGTTREGGYMNSSDTNTGGWNQCARRAWCNEVYKAALPSTFVGILKQHQNITAAGTGSTTTTSSDYVALPAETEVFGSVTYANSTAEASLTQFKYYETASNRIKYQGNSGSAIDWWERSPLTSSSYSFCRVSSGGAASNSFYASSTYGFAPFFCI